MPRVQNDLAALMAREFRSLAGQARATLPRLRGAPALADCVGDWADELKAVGDSLSHDVLPIAGLRRLTRAHALLLAELRLLAERP